METLDRRISASTDQLDTLKREKKSDRSVWGLPPEDAGGRHSRGHHFNNPINMEITHLKARPFYC